VVITQVVVVAVCLFFQERLRVQAEQVVVVQEHEKVTEILVLQTQEVVAVVLIMVQMVQAGLEL
jgi:hypothetical protein